MFSQEGSALRLEQTWALITQQVLQVGARGGQRGVDSISALGGGSHFPSLSPLASSQTSSLLTVFFFFVLVSFTVSPANLPVLLDCGIFSHPLPPPPVPPELGEGWQQVSSWVPAFTILWLGRYYLLYFSSHLPSLGGKVATGNWPRICLPPFSNAPSPSPPTAPVSP